MDDCFDASRDQVVGERDRTLQCRDCRVEVCFEQVGERRFKGHPEVVLAPFGAFSRRHINDFTVGPRTGQVLEKIGGRQLVRSRREKAGEHERLYIEMGQNLSVAPAIQSTWQVEIKLRNCVSNPFPLANKGVPNLHSVQILKAFHRSAWGLNDPGVWSGEELALVTVLPLHPVVLSRRSSHHLEDLAVPPSRVDLDGLDDDPISRVCMHNHPPSRFWSCQASWPCRYFLTTVAGHGDGR